MPCVWKPGTNTNFHPRHQTCLPLTLLGLEGVFLDQACSPVLIAVRPTLYHITPTCHHFDCNTRYRLSGGWVWSTYMCLGIWRRARQVFQQSRCQLPTISTKGGWAPTHTQSRLHTLSIRIYQWLISMLEMYVMSYACNEEYQLRFAITFETTLQRSINRSTEAAGRLICVKTHDVGLRTGTSIWVITTDWHGPQKATAQPLQTCNMHTVSNNHATIIFCHTVFVPSLTSNLQCQQTMKLMGCSIRKFGGWHVSYTHWVKSWLECSGNTFSSGGAVYPEGIFISSLLALCGQLLLQDLL